MAPHRHMDCVLKVDTQCSGWEKCVTKVIKRIKDVSYTIDTARGYVHICGTINPQKLLTDVKRAGKNARIVHLDCGVNSQSHANYGSYGYHGYNGGYGYSDRHHHHHNHYVPTQGGYLPHQNTHVLPLPPPPPMNYAYEPYYPNPYIM